MTRYFVFHNNGQVQATQSSNNAPDPTAWETDKGFERLEVTAAQFATIDRDKKLTLDRGKFKSVADSVNPVQPVLSVRDTRIGELRDSFDTLDDTGLREYIKLRDGIR